MLYYKRATQNIPIDTYMKKILFSIIVVVLATLSLFSVTAFAESDSLVYAPVTFESAIQFTATPQKDGSVEMKWSRYNHTEDFSYYKLVRSQDNSDPVYPEDGHIFFDSNLDTLTYTDTDSPVGTSFYRICQIAQPKRYCSQKVWMITKDATIDTPEALLTKNTQEDTIPGFTDVPQSHWAAACISRLAKNDIIQSGGVAFRPADPVNRAEFLKFVMKAYYPEDTVAGESGCFNDVSSGQWFSPFVCAAKEKDIVSGYFGNLYRPANRITRAEGVAIVVKALRLPVVNGPPIDFTDVIAPWQKSFVYAAVKENVVEGYDETRFGPNDAMSRQQAAKIICNALDNRPKPLEQIQDYSIISNPLR